MTRLTTNFSLEEFMVSSSYPDIAKEMTVNDLERYKLFTIAATILQPVRDNFDSAMNIHSGKRTAQLNTLIGGSRTTQHVLCEAADWAFADIEFNKKKLLPAVAYIRDVLPFNFLQLILYLNEDYSSNFIHVSIHSMDQRKKRKILICHKGLFYIWEDLFKKALEASL